MTDTERYCWYHDQTHGPGDQDMGRLCAAWDEVEPQVRTHKAGLPLWRWRRWYPVKKAVWCSWRHRTRRESGVYVTRTCYACDTIIPVRIPRPGRE